jgi:hypothetical protein
MLQNTLTKVEAETGIESDKNSMRTDMIIWMKNNGIL